MTMIGPKQQLRIRDAVKGDTVRIPYSFNTSWKSVGAVEIVKIKDLGKGMVQIKYLPMYILSRKPTVQKVDMPGDVIVTREPKPVPRPVIKRQIEQKVETLSPGQAVMVPSMLGAGILSVLGEIGIPISLRHLQEDLDLEMRLQDGLSDRAKEALSLYAPSGIKDESGIPGMVIGSAGNIA